MWQDFGPTIYLMASRRDGTLHLGVTSDLLQRKHLHLEDLVPGFTRE
ncbi:hypothetical protein [Sphingopyxis witflariensis]